MKKFLTILSLATVTTPVLAFPDAGVIQVHDMQMINQQRFRMEEINDYKEVQEEKERFRKKNAPSEVKINRIQQPNDSKFIQDGNEIKIKYE